MGDFDLVRTFGQIPMSRPLHIKRKFSHPILAKIAELRLEHKMSIKDHCEIAGVSHRTVQSMHNRGVGQYKTIEALANALGYELMLTKRPSAQKDPK